MMPLVKYQTIKGTFDRLPDDAAKWNFVLKHAKQVLERFGAGEIHTPIFEDTGVFTKAVGESSDIVRKEMYNLTDRGNRELTLRPEATAPMIRAYLEHGMGSRPTPVKFWTFEPMFRGEKPQRGRERQFHQVGFEIIGLADPITDAETIDAGFQIFESLGIKKYVIHLGSVGDPEDRQEFNAYLRKTLSPVVEKLSKDSVERLELNPMRILDSKAPVDQEILKNLQVKPMLEFLGAAAREHFSGVQDHLRAWGVPFVVDPSIVRGLDYYRRTAYEFIHTDPSMAGCSTILAGGRYDGLAEILGGPHTPGIGFGMGCERVLLALEAEAITVPTPDPLLVYVIPLEDDSISFAHSLARDVRGVGKAQAAYKVKAMGKALADAEKLGAVYAIVVGGNERESQLLNVRHLQTRTQETVAATGLSNWLRTQNYSVNNSQAQGSL
jgi:histidyl-tRNA synthetase